MNRPRISFGVIVLNGEPFTKYCLRSIYPYAFQIIVVEGACNGAEAIATPNGHSVDGTLEVLRDFKAHEDPENKLILITRDGFWDEKDQQSEEYTKKASGNYLWQVDIDEFYRSSDMEKVIELLSSKPSVTAISFRQLTFWGGPNYRCDSWLLRQGASEYHRLFAWGEYFRYSKHRPPTVINARGDDLRKLQWLNAEATESMGIQLFHYSLLLPEQVKMKGIYYSNSPLMKRTGWNDWMRNSYMTLRKPYKVHNMYEYPSWLEYYRGDHPEQFTEMWQSICAEKTSFKPRSCDDIEILLSSPLYSLGRYFLKILSPVDHFWRKQVRDRIIWHFNAIRIKILGKFSKL